jgi:hypothetical protein
MLLAIFGAVGLGLLAKDFGRRTSLLAMGLAVALATIYLLRPHYMT